MSVPADRSAPPWSDPPPTLAVGGDEVHVWRAALDRPGELAELFAALSPDERARAARFRAARDGDRFVAGRGLLRVILGRYLAREPAALRFRYGPHGKPDLVDDGAGWRLRFNVSHADGLALYAVAEGREVGVDLERVRSDVDVEAIAVWFSPRERAALAALPASRRREAFFAYWTHKEAWLKAVGGGLSLPLDRCEVDFAAPAAPILREGDAATASRWTLRTLAPAPGYAAALAVEGGGWRLACWRWPDGSGPTQWSAAGPAP